jgi:DNA gyrase subunit B
MPRYIVKVGAQEEYVFDDKELAEITKDDTETQYIEVFESEEIEPLQEKLDGLDIFLQDYKRSMEEQVLLAKDKKEKGKPRADLKPLFLIEDDKVKTQLMSVVDILHYVRESAKKGMHTQRYKGLGEMNPQQLWETTMDPERRTILKVTLEDAVEVDKTFAMLMGDEVEPRRQFIESYAHEVKNLDI